MAIVYNIEGIDYLHIQQFVDLIGRSQQSTRHLINEGNSVRRMKSRRDRSRILIPLAELAGYPFVNTGAQQTAKDIYHYVPYKNGKRVASYHDAVQDEDVEWRRELCELCTYTVEHCIFRQVADAANIPKGDD